MNFFRKLFGMKSNLENQIEENEVEKEQIIINEKQDSPIPSKEEILSNRFSEQTIQSIEGMSKTGTEILKQFLLSKNIEYINNPFSHPINLDFGISYKNELLDFSKSQGFDRNMTLVTLSFILSEYFVKNLNFQLFLDKQAEAQELGLVLINNEDKNLVVYPLVAIINSFNEQPDLNDLLNQMRRESSSKINNNYSYNDDIETIIKEDLNKEEKKGILLEVNSIVTDDKIANEQNAFFAAKILDKKLQQEILKFYDWYTLPDLDTNLQCTMQLIKKEVYQRMDKSFTGEVQIEMLFKKLNEEE